MPRGKKFVNHKGRSRHFTSPEELQQESEENSDEENSSNESADNGADIAAGGTKASTSKTASSTNVGRHKQTSTQRKVTRPISSEEESDDDDESDDDEDDRGAKKGVASLIEIENPNRAVKKSTQKVANLSLEESNIKPDLTRREREQIEKQKARRKYEKLHAAGKTREAKSDLARLALIRQQREEAAAKREAEKKAQESHKD